MIKPVTFNAAQNFKANLYALETGARFVDSSMANGYYKGYGDELDATLIGTSAIRIGSGAILVQGRMVEIVTSETVPIAYENGKVGFVICRIETMKDGENCTLIVKTAPTFEDISIVQENTYAYESETENRTYELPLYRFTMQNNTIGSIEKLIKPVHDLEEIIKQVYPIGAIYMSVVDTSPALLFGGVWSIWGQGLVPVGVKTNDSAFMTAERTGGEYHHTLTEYEMPSHQHIQRIQRSYWSMKQVSGEGAIYATIDWQQYRTSNSELFETTEWAGGGLSHNNMQPYITCYMWKRIA